MQRSKNEICILCGKTHNSGRNIIEYFQCTVCEKLQQLPHDVCGFGGVDGIECTCGRKADAVWKQISFEEYKKLTSAGSEMTNEEILANAPEGATHITSNNVYLKVYGNHCHVFNSLHVWSIPITNIEDVFILNNPRSLFDIFRIVELEKKQSKERRETIADHVLNILAEEGFENFSTNMLKTNDGRRVELTIRYTNGKTPAEVLDELTERVEAAERERDDMKANIDHLMKDCHRFTDKRLNEFAIEQKIFELERFMQTFIKAAMDAPVPEINWQANELMRKALIGALETAKNERIVELKEQLV